ncbi:MAG TPA: long-chain fatty acid--CoA ligase [Kineosporiaceae bacterium]|nr:long-chain fatty acid--CoA ligase [Kineosporiaceae bacterium]
MRNQGIGSWTARRARKTPRSVAMVSGDQQWTYAELESRVAALARGLAELGIGAGDRVGYLGPNHPTFLETLFALGRLGAVFVPLNTRLAAPELAYQLQDSGSRALVCSGSPAVADAAAGLARTVGLKHWIALPGALEQPPVEGALVAYEDLITGGSAGAGGDTGPEQSELPDLAVGLDDVCIIMYTSGTTGRPKGATLTHGNITWNAVNVLVDADFRDDEVTLVTAPMFHTAALNMSLLPTLLKGGRVVIEPGFEPERAVDLIETAGVTCLFGVPAMYASILQSPRWAQVDLSRVRNLLCGGAPVPEPLIRAYTERGLSFIQGYGMTETSPGALLLDRDRVQTKLGSAGYPHFFTDVKVVRPDGSEVGVGEKGEIVVQGPNVMAGYWQNPQATATSLVDGWFHTGDVAVVDTDGAVYVVDRIKDMIISGGENIYPAEVESALHEHPAVLDCAVIGVPDEKWGEVGRAVVVLVPGQEFTVEQMREFLTERLARYKIPRSLSVVEALPRNASGKILRKNLRESPPA